MITEPTAGGAGLSFGPANAVTFDLGRGLVEQQGAGAGILVPAVALSALCAAAGSDAVRAFGREVGVAMGHRIATRLGGAGTLGAPAVRSATLGTVVDELGGEVALAGLGAVTLERWGRALVVCVDGSPLGAEGDALVEAVLEGAFQAATGSAATTVRLEREGARARFFIGGSAATVRVRGWIREAVSWADALARLHAGRSEVASSSALEAAKGSPEL